MEKYIDITRLKSGDVILCGGDDKISQKIQGKTDSQYSHAAICHDERSAVEAGIEGIVRTQIHDVVARYEYVAVFRNPFAWDSRRVGILKVFLDEVVSSKKRYNFRALPKFKKRKEDHEITLFSQLENFFEGSLEPIDPAKKSYFCSELVVDCFRVTNFIEPSAAVQFRSDIVAPGDLGRSGVFGTFLGYIRGLDGFDVPEEDEFYHDATFDEIYVNQEG